jgi:hypothetical protein
MPVAEAMNARPRPADQLETLFAEGWPAFITADQCACCSGDTIALYRRGRWEPGLGCV